MRGRTDGRSPGGKTVTGGDYSKPTRGQHVFQKSILYLYFMSFFTVVEGPEVKVLSQGFYRLMRDDLAALQAIR